jgi:hypothetical protein
MVSAMVLGGCQTGRELSDPFSDAGPRSNSVTVYVTNLAFSDATLYAVTTGTRHQLGRVTGKQEAVFTMPLPFPTVMFIEIDLMAGPKCFTDQLTVDPGDEFELIVRNEGANVYCES